MKHMLKSSFLNRQLRMHVIGAGGTGSRLINGLASIHLALAALGHPGIKVTVFDPDRVSEANIGRQLFYPAELGKNKAICLVHRINLALGLEWEACPEKFSERGVHNPDIIISCVDSRKSRLEIDMILKRTYQLYFMDCGNGSDYGQVYIGDGSKELPYPYDLYPDLIDTKLKEDNKPSCSLIQALHSQDLFINQWVATCALQLIWQLLGKGGIDHRGYKINTRTGKTIALPIELT